MKADVLRETPIVPPVTAYVVTLTPEEAKALFAVTNFHSTAASAVSEALTRHDLFVSPSRRASYDEMNIALASLFRVLYDAGIEKR